MAITLDQYGQQFARLTQAPNRIFPATTKHKAPHKPLLLAVMEMVRRGEIITRFISITDHLTELSTLFTA